MPHLPDGLRSDIAINAVMKDMTRQFFVDHDINEYLFWYYTPMALKFTDHFDPIASVYDCMDELSAFKGAHSQLPVLEKQLFKHVDLVFTGGQSLYEAKRNQHPCSVSHFRAASTRRTLGKRETAIDDPEDQARHSASTSRILRRDRRAFRHRLLDEVASQRPDWHFVIIGPVVKIDPETLPQACQTFTISVAKKYERASGLPGGLGRRVVVVCSQRIDSLYQSDENTRISRGRQARDLDFDQRRRAALRRIEAG